MRWRLKAAKADLSPERALEYLRRIQHHRIRLNATEPVTGISAISAEQTRVLTALAIKKPPSVINSRGCRVAFSTRPQ